MDAQGCFDFASYEHQKLKQKYFLTHLQEGSANQTKQRGVFKSLSMMPQHIARSEVCSS